MEFQHYFYLAYVRRTFLCVSLQEMRPKSLASTMNSRVCTAASLGGLHVHLCQVDESVREYVVCMRLCVYFYVRVQCTRICIHMYTYIYISYMNAFYSVCVCIYIYICVYQLLKKMTQRYAIRTGMRAYPNPKCLHHKIQSGHCANLLFKVSMSHLLPLSTSWTETALAETMSILDLQLVVSACASSFRLPKHCKT